MREAEHTNPPITSLLRGVTAVEVVVLTLAGIGLLFGVAWAVSVWPWVLKPFNQRFLGALYSAALVAAAWQTVVARWAPARSVTWMIFVFTTVVTALSFVHIEQFDFARYPVWIWFILYVGVAINAGLHLAFAKDAHAALGPAPDRAQQAVLRVVAVVYGTLGLAHLVAPAWLGSKWPWPIDSFHAQLYSVAFLTPAVAAVCLMRGALAVDWRTQGSTHLAWGLLPIAGLLVADASARRVGWSEPFTLLWLAAYAGLVVWGVWLWRQARKTER
jgi:hypothetical protein